MRVALQPIAKTLLANRAFDIEFHGYLSNHVKHAIVALNGLEAPASRIQEYWDGYTSETPYGLHLDAIKEVDVWNAAENPMKLQDWKAWHGKKVHWSKQVLFLQDKLDDDDDIDKLVQQFAPDLLPGMVGALMHGIIHLGWGIDAGSPWMTLEGLAYLNFASVPVDESKLVENVHDEATPIQSLERVATTFHQEQLATTWIEPVKAKYDESFHPELVAAGFQWQVSKVLHEPHAVATELPTWLSSSKEPLPVVWERLYQAVSYVYLATREHQTDGSPAYHGNFVVLHLITCLWAVEQVCNVVKDEAVTRRALRCYYSAMISVLSTGSTGFPSVESLQQAQVDFPLEDTSLAAAFNDADWTSVVQAAIAESEEHNIKLVYVMRELAQRYPAWKGYQVCAKSFTLTPLVGVAGKRRDGSRESSKRAVNSLQQLAMTPQ